jgi:hypothetical protein
LLRFFKRYNPRTFPLRRYNDTCPIAFAMGGAVDNADAMFIDPPVVLAIDSVSTGDLGWASLSAKKIVDTIKAVERADR